MEGGGGGGGGRVLTKGREGINERLPAVDALVALVVQERVGGGTAIAHGLQLL